jgi:hypothetical protein
LNGFQAPLSLTLPLIYQYPFTDLLTTMMNRCRPNIPDASTGGELAFIPKLLPIEILHNIFKFAAQSSLEFRITCSLIDKGARRHAALPEMLYVVKLLSKIRTRRFVNYLSGWTHDNRSSHDSQYPGFDPKSFVQCLLARKYLAKDFLHILDVCLNVTEIALTSAMFVMMFSTLPNPRGSGRLGNKCWLPRGLASGRSLEITILDDPSGTEWNTLRETQAITAITHLVFVFPPPSLPNLFTNITHVALPVTSDMETPLSKFMPHLELLLFLVDSDEYRTFQYSRAFPTNDLRDKLCMRHLLFDRKIHFLRYSRNKIDQSWEQWARGLSIWDEAIRYTRKTAMSVRFILYGILRLTNPRFQQFSTTIIVIP